MKPKAEDGEYKSPPSDTILCQFHPATVASKINADTIPSPSQFSTVTFHNRFLPNILHVLIVSPTLPTNQYVEESDVACPNNTDWPV
jgi:hypothetical protein